MRRLSALLVMLIASAPLAADEIVVEGMTYSDIDVTGVAGGVITIRMPDGRGVRKWLGDVQKITLTGNAAFNKAEELLAAGKYDAAIEAYQSLGASGAAWQRTLVAERLSLAKDRKANAPAPAPASASPVPKPADSRPAPPGAVSGAVGSSSKPDPAPADRPAKPAVNGDLTTPETMADILRKRPLPPDQKLSWQQMTKQEKDEAQTQYKDNLARWDEAHNYRGRKIYWALRVQSAMSDASRTVVAMTSANGYVITATIEDGAANPPSQFKDGQQVELSGVIEDYKIEVESGGFFDSSAVKFGVAVVDASVKPAAPGPKAPGSKAPGPKTPAKP